jgi:hypothetical protein
VSVWIAGASTVVVYGGILALLGMGYVRREDEPKAEEDKA